MELIAIIVLFGWFISFMIEVTKQNYLNRLEKNKKLHYSVSKMNSVILLFALKTRRYSIIKKELKNKIWII